jgi:hypothetical protein
MARPCGARLFFGTGSAVRDWRALNKSAVQVSHRSAGRGRARPDFGAVLVLDAARNWCASGGPVHAAAVMLLTQEGTDIRV